MSPTKATTPAATDEQNERLLARLAMIRSDPGTPRYAVHFLRAVIPLGITIPAAVHAAADRYAEGDRRGGLALRELTKGRVTGEQLLADDIAETIRAAVLADVVAERGLSVARSAVSELQTALIDACADAVDTVAGVLESWFLEHYDELAAVGTRRSTDSVYLLEQRDEQMRLFQIAHRALLCTGPDSLGAGAGRIRDYRAQWWATHAWTPGQWDRLVDSAGPGMAYPEHRRLDLARQLGATARLARSPQQCWDEFVRMMEGVATTNLHGTTRTRTSVVTTN